MHVSIPLRRLHRIAMALALVLAFGAAAANADESIAGTYDAHGTNPGGKQYSGVVEIVADGGSVRRPFRESASPRPRA